MGICKVEACDEKSSSLGMCMKHYTRYRKYGDPLAMKRPTPKKQLKKCVIDDCEKRPYATGLCSAHYTRNRRHGSPLGGRTPQGAPFQWIKDHVEYDGDDCLDWPFSKGRGYGLIVYEGSFMSAPKLMCEMAHGPAPTPAHECAHNCGQGQNGCINPKHLRWATRTENHRDKYMHKTMPMGENHCRSKLKEKDVLRIRSLQGDVSGRQLAQKYEVDPGTIYAIWNRRNWKWL